MKYIFILTLLVSTLFSADDLQECVQSTVSKTSVIFTCMHGEYYIEYESTSKRDVKEIKILYTKADKYKYLKNLKRLPKDID
ncbi:MAG: hypothetical protein C0626_04810 [Arcobacter sp.]|uniref:hypothetical protein n=1 Tax=uncultured Arcobacter sp. TaxID=165434 RepID=UPI000CB09321|nr:hypothetical protein [uncultured Arcobacter sp.]PLY10314.1 MAG: hypothetical protein C0626_04810 [Arcobacter sp.]